ncbi:MAG: adenine phosphoribosyltransferase [Ruminococcus sp.]|nr:adenine phosphoribosyltransferase [Ruminococcus sp.]CDF00713.1 phosphoribosyl transferase domain protein [Ruminococcus sp. CAG:624]MCI6889235.1 adenine phosphoribosyltransferase [Ruminococcus sp.]MDD6634464.1 phosphoribosyltransferase family protein [Ruminococcus sp.]MDY3214662.1 phosphoribosyltransferase family protein [Ruminococcus sp.]
MEKYTINVAGLKRDLKLCPLDDKIDIAAFIMFSDVELTIKSAEELIKKAPECDVILTAESKGIPLAYEMSRQLGIPYVVARKSVKLYMTNVVSVEVKSITTSSVQTLYLDGEKAELLKGKRVLIVDDVISTGESLRALEKLTESADGIIVGKAAVLAEGDAADRKDIIFLEKLPLFFK